MTASDFAALTRHGAECGSDGALRLAGFERVMRDQIRAYALALLSTSPLLLSSQVGKREELVTH